MDIASVIIVTMDIASVRIVTMDINNTNQENKSPPWIFCQTSC